MASKSKKRRRVLGASCILAALIIAGSSFAWFTSKDEVTNRLTASNDYGVSIVESFTPPKNWIPGQTINKDVYAVNTGNIDAFVKESISGLLNYTYEKREATAPDATGVTAEEKAKYVKLTNDKVRAIDGVTTHEGGGYLAWTDAKDSTDSTKPAMTPGPIISATNTDVEETEAGTDSPGEVEGTAWHPTQPGAYVFRRSYVPEVKESGNPIDPDYVAPQAAYYTYAGYYFDGTDYYKIVLGSDDFRTYKDADNNDVFDVSASQNQIGATGDASTATVAIDADGAVTDGAIAYQFVKEEKVTDAVPYLTYHANSGGTDNVAFLQAYYSAGDTDESADFLSKQAAADQAAAAAEQAYRDYLDAIGDEALAEIEYENAVGAYNAAVSRYNQALADWTYANALSNASQDIIDAADRRATAQIEYDNALDDLNKALEAVKLEASTLKGTPANTTVSPLDDSTNKTKFEDLLAFSDNTDISYKSIFQTTVPTTNTNGTLEDIITHQAQSLANGLVQNQSILTAADEYRSQMSTLWGTDGSTDDSNIVGASARLNTALTAFASLANNSPTGADQDAQACLDELKAARDNLETLLKRYQALYQNLKTVATSETTLTQLLEGDDTTNFASKISAWLTRLNSMKDTIVENNSDEKIGEFDIADGGTVQSTPTSPATGRFGIDAIVQDYKIKYANYVKEKNIDLPAAQDEWKQAVKDYNTAVNNTDGAGKTYSDDIRTDQRRRDEVKDDGDDDNIVYSKNDYEGLTTNGTAPATTDTAPWYLTDNNEKIVKVYAVMRPTNGDPSLSAYINGDTWQTVAGVSGEDLWKTIGSNAAMPNTAAEGYTDAADKNWTFSKTGVDVTSPASYTELATTASSATNTPEYVKAVIAKAVGKDAFRTLVSNTHDSNKYDTVDNLKAATEGTVLSAMNTKKTAYESKIANTAAKDAAQSSAAGVASAAQGAANNAAAADSSAIKINIYLDDEASTLDWTSALGDGESAKVADFYYNYILEAGKTSEKLIDAVELDPSVGTKDYKELVFDLNVALDSVQVTYADNQRDITSEAVTEESFGKTATIDSQTPDASGKGIKVTWGDAAYTAPATVYRVGLDTVTVTDLEAGDQKTVADGTYKGVYKYSVTIGTTTYYGTSKADGTKFYEFNGDDVKTPVNAVTLNVVQ